MRTITHLLDTCIYSARLKPRPDPCVVERWKQLGNHALAISSICEAELLFGLHKRNSPRLWQEYRGYLENQLVLLPVDLRVSQIFGEQKAQLQANGTLVADADLLIASTALAHDLTLVTDNTKHFTRVPGLRVESWTT